MQLFSRQLLIGLFIGLLPFFSGCTIHKVDVQQGNVVPPEAMEKLKVGMTQQQVNSLLGSPLIVDPFRDNRWDYVYSMKLGVEGKLQSSHVTLLFEDKLLKDIRIAKPPIAEKDLLKPQLYRTQ